jgi:hypothetical protein
MVLGVAERVWTVGELLDAALATQPTKPKTTAPDRRKPNVPRISHTATESDTTNGAERPVRSHA